MQEDHGGHGAGKAKRERLAEFPLAALPVHAGVEGQPQPKEGPQVFEEAGKGRGVEVDPFRPLAPSLGFLQGPQKVYPEAFQQQVKSECEAKEEEGDETIFPEAGVVDAPDVAESFSHSNACAEESTVRNRDGSG